MDLVQVVNDHLPEGTRPISSLAAPGEINRSVVAILREHAPMEEVSKMFGEMLKATRITKHGEQPDWRAREAAGKFIAAYTEGLPVQRTESVNVNLDADTGEGLRERLAKSPALRAAIRKKLEEAEAIEAETVAEK